MRNMNQNKTNIQNYSLDYAYINQKHPKTDCEEENWKVLREMRKKQQHKNI